MSISVNIPDRMFQYINEPYDSSVKELLVVELYREGLITLRQAADMLNVGTKEMFAVLLRRKSYLNYGREELNEDISYARSE
ncbi:MAG: UPF0175 family protein [Candidatus Tectomicrobia bacterium]|uniref:UPF0175 family protein n=1 Tax=Tectimicrobiota bacterium TaxID=2528274 RepID=A0A933LRL5_UNCTE|nr:UPF0175 family protein [Candidatus Tectomicrobia bacterium]